MLLPPPSTPEVEGELVAPTRVQVEVMTPQMLVAQTSSSSDAEKKGFGTAQSSSDKLWLEGAAVPGRDAVPPMTPPEQFKTPPWKSSFRRGANKTAAQCGGQQTLIGYVRKKCAHSDNECRKLTLAV